MAVMNAQYKHPSTGNYSQGLRDLIDATLKVSPSERPDIHQVCHYRLDTAIDYSTCFLLAFGDDRGCSEIFKLSSSVCIFVRSIICLSHKDLVGFGRLF